MGRHGVAGSPASSISRRYATDDDDTAIFLRLGRGVGVRLLLCKLPHGRGRVLEREEGGHGVRLEASLEVGWGGIVDRRWPEQAGRADPDVEAAKGVQDLVDEHDRFLLLCDVKGIRDDLGMRVVLGHGIDKVLVLVQGCRLVTGVYRSRAVGCQLLDNGLADGLRSSCNNTDEAVLGVC